MVEQQLIVAVEMSHFEATLAEGFKRYYFDGSKHNIRATHNFSHCEVAEKPDQS